MERAEQVLREALTEHAGEAPDVAHSLVPPAGSRRQRPWGVRLAAPLMAAAAVVTVGYVVLDGGPADDTGSDGGAASRDPQTAIPSGPGHDGGDVGARPDVSAPAPSASAEPPPPAPTAGPTTRDGTLVVTVRAPATDATVTGRLEVVDGCLRLDGRRAVALPPGVTAVGSGPVALRLPGGDVVEPGDTVAGGARIVGADRLAGWEAPARCVAGARWGVELASIRAVR